MCNWWRAGKVTRYQGGGGGEGTQRGRPAVWCSGGKPAASIDILPVEDAWSLLIWRLKYGAKRVRRWEGEGRGRGGGRCARLVEERRRNWTWGRRCWGRAKETEKAKLCLSALNFARDSYIFATFVYTLCCYAELYDLFFLLFFSEMILKESSFVKWFFFLKITN